MTATSTEQRTESSCAFLNNPPLRLRNVLESGQFSDRDHAGRHLHRTIPIILDRLDFNLSSAHGSDAPNLRKLGRFCVLIQFYRDCRTMRPFRVDFFSGLRRDGVHQKYADGYAAQRCERRGSLGLCRSRSRCWCWRADRLSRR